jgi:ribosomal protein L11 methyltransferase
MRVWPALDITFPDGSSSDQTELLDRVEGALLTFSITAIDEGAPDARPCVWRVFFPDRDARDRAAALLAESFPHPHLSVTSLDVEDRDWAAVSQAGLRAVQVGNVIVAPPWDVPERRDETPGLKPAAPVTVVIQPSMGFGTGHHATTRMCLAALQHLDLRGLSVIDVGTGSGVLALAAKRLGAGRVLAIDEDECAIQSARENLTLNPGVDVTLGVRDLRRAALRPFDLVIANLTGALLISAARAIVALSGGLLILSGFLASEEDAVLRAFAGWHVNAHMQEDEWGCLLLSIREATPKVGADSEFVP